MDSTLAILLSLNAGPFKSEYDVTTALKDKLRTPVIVPVEMVSKGGETMGAQIEKDAQRGSAASNALAQSVAGSNEKIDESTKEHSASAGQALSGFSGKGIEAGASMDKLFGKTLGAVSGMAGPLEGMLPLAASVGFGALLLGSTTTATALQNFEHQAGVSIDVAKQWVGAANDFQIPPRILSMTLKNLGTMLDNVTNSQGKAVASSKNDAALTFQLSQEKESLAIAQAKATYEVDRWGNSSTQAATATQAVQKIQEQIVVTNGKLAASQSTLTGLTAVQRQALQGLGVSLTDSSGKVISETELMYRLSDAYANSSDKQKANIELTTLLGGRAYALLPLLEQGGAALKDTLDKGATSLSGFNQSNVDSLSKAGVSIRNIEESVKNALTQVASDLTPVIDYISNHINELKTAAEVIGGFYLANKGRSLIFGLAQDLTSFPGAILHDIVDTYNKIPLLPNIGGSKGGGGVGAGGGAIGAVDSALGQRVFVTNFAEIGGANLLGDAAKAGGGGAATGVSLGLGETLSTYGLGSTLVGVGGVIAEAIPPIAAATAGIAAIYAGGIRPLLASFSPSGDHTSGSSAFWTADSKGGGAVSNLGDMMQHGGPNSPIAGGSWNPADQARAQADLKAFNYDLTQLAPNVHLTNDQIIQVGNAWKAGKITSDNELLLYLQSLTGVQISTAGWMNTVNATSGGYTVAMKDAQNQFSILEASFANHGPKSAQYMADFETELHGTLLAGSDFHAATLSLADLAAHGKVTSSADMGKYEGFWNDVQGYAHDTADAQKALAALEVSGKITNEGQVQKFISIWNGTLAATGGIPPTMDSLNGLFGNALANTQTLPEIINSMVWWIGEAQRKAQMFANQMNLANISAAMGHTTQGSGSQGQMGTKFGATGAIINEHIYGVGVSGQKYEFGENGPETVSPIGGSNAVSTGMGGVSIVVTGNTIMSQTHIDDLVRQIETRLTTTILPNAGRKFTF